MRLSASQQEILRLLRREGELTVEELSRHMGISKVAVRQHLEILEADGLLSTRSERRPVGRPRRLYRLSEAADDLFPKSYSVLAEMILEHLQDSGGPARVAEFFESRRRRLEREVLPMLAGQGLEGRVRALAQFQDQAGYMAECEALPEGGFVIREHNCAICKVARRFPQACQKELEMFQSLLDADVERQQHMAAGDAMCSYLVRPRSHASLEPSLSLADLVPNLVTSPTS
jgi:predicted ArsR family transcriptional regulator